MNVFLLLVIPYLSRMVLYNVTVILDEAVERQWLAWVQSGQLPQIMATDAFISNRILKVLDSPNEGVTYCIQFIADSRKQVDHYRNNFEGSFNSAIAEKFPNQFVSFNTLMVFIDQQ